MCTVKAPKVPDPVIVAPPPPAPDPYLAPDAPGASGAAPAVRRSSLRIKGGGITGAPNAGSSLGIPTMKVSTIGTRG